MSRVSADGPYLGPGQAARILGVSSKTVTRWALEGLIPCVLTLGGHRRFRPGVIAAVAASMGLEDDREADDPSEHPPPTSNPG